MRNSDEPIPADLEFYDYDTRLAAYAVIVEDDSVLLSWWNGEGHGEPAWSLPGGGVDLPETTEQGLLREVREETGFAVELTGLLTVDSHVLGPRGRWLAGDPRGRRLHRLRRVGADRLGARPVACRHRRCRPGRLARRFCALT